MNTQQTPPGRFITFEGPEGGGKTTQVMRLCARLEAAGIVCVRTAEPGGTPVGQELRAMLLAPDRPALAPATEALLMCAGRAEHVASLIRPSLAQGKTVLCDRFIDSTIAHQGHGVGLPVEALHALNAFATGGLLPDLTVLIDLDVEVGLARKRAAFQTGRGELNRIDRRDRAYHERVRAAFLDMAAAAPRRWVVVDGTLSLDDVEGLIWQCVAHVMGLA